MSEVTITKERVDQFVEFTYPTTICGYAMSFKAGEIRAIAMLAKECLSRRSADEGAVTMEGWIFREEGGSHTFTPGDIGKGMVGWERASITIRTRP